MILLVDVINYHADELLADFQQYYGLDASTIGKEISYERAAILCSQLPRGSRVLRQYDSRSGWDVCTSILANVEYELRLWIWANSDKKKRGKAPKPIEPAPNKRDIERIRIKRLTVEENNQIKLVKPEELLKAFSTKK